MFKVNSKRGKKSILSVLLVLAMTLAMSFSVFAASPGTYDTTLYKEGTYGKSNQAVSMGNPAILNSDVVYNSVTNKTTVTVYVTSMKYKPILITYTGYITALTLDGTVGTRSEDKIPGTDYPTSFTFEFDGHLSGTVKFNVNFGLDIKNFIHTDPKGDLVISNIQ